MPWLLSRFVHRRRNCMLSGLVGEKEPSIIYDSHMVDEELQVIPRVTVPASARNYIGACILLFTSSLMTWVPSSINRIWALVSPDHAVPFPLACTAAFLLQLTGFWNSIVYFMKTTKELGDLFKVDILPKLV